jgi:hypothetical protein
MEYLKFGHRYTASERATVPPPPCPTCASRNVTPHWREVTNSELTERMWTPTLWTCRECSHA